MSLYDDLRIELAMVDAVLQAATKVVSEWRVRGDHQVGRDFELALTLAVNDLHDWRDQDVP